MTQILIFVYNNSVDIRKQYKFIIELAKETGIKSGTLRGRLKRNPSIALEELIKPV